MEEGVEERPPPPAPRPRSRRMSVITVQEANAELARTPSASRRMSVITVQEANAEQARTPLSPKRISGTPSFPDSRRGGHQCSDDIAAENYWRRVLRSADGPFGRAPSENPLDKSGSQLASPSSSTFGLNTMTLNTVAGSGPVFVLSCNRRFESIGEALRNVCQGEVVRLQPRMYLESRGLVIDKDNVTLTSVSIGSDQQASVRISVRSSDPHALLCRAWGIVVKGIELVQVKEEAPAPAGAAGERAERSCVCVDAGDALVEECLLSSEV
eukprot:CAMPEP_0172159156 /NCGR_PEP_ID=MMETSP1050-20130122/4804_1 /TAXON_ID=233186 /ORGANISM="Cryptomonas curvata, Strain CCAP979/52" /LENGTH=269 /DNA_ID=CAMNT_0012828693 /DNA_START=133 /DNA_END=938 /DNA_ORIENTATION=-